MLHPAPPQGTVVRDALTHPRFSRRPDLVLAYLALHASRTDAGAVDLDAAKSAARHSLEPATWGAALSTLTQEGLLYLEGLEPRLAPLSVRGAFRAAWETFATMVPTLRAKTIAAYRAEVARALELAGFAVDVDERVPAGAKSTVPVHALAVAGGVRVALVCCSAKAVEANARKLRLADVERAFLLVHPSNDLVDVRAVKVSEAGEAFDPEQVDLPPNVPREAWLKWVAYRRECRKPLTRQSVTQQLQVLVDASAAAADVIMTSINSSWLGLFPPRRPMSAGAPVPRGTTQAAPPPFKAGELVEVRLPDGRTKVVTVEVVSSHYVIDETGATHPIETVSAHQPLRRAS